MSLLGHLASNGHRTLVFSQSRAMLDVLERAANADGHSLVRIDGKVPADERHARVERFQSDPSIKLALLTSQVGGLGLTLTAADRVVIYDPAWNPAADSQSVDRAYRIGQTRDVVVYRLVTCGTVEEKVYRRQVFKGGLSRAGTQDGNHFRYFSADETSQLFEVTESGMRSSRTQAELERLHAHQRRWTEELKNVEAPMLTRLGCAGVSDHDLLFSKEDSTKAGDGASVLSAGGGGGFGGSGATRDAVVTRVRSKRGYRVVLAVDVTGSEACVDVTEALRDAVSRASSVSRGADGTDDENENENADPEWKISVGVAHAFARHTSASLVVGSARDGFGVSFVRALDDALPFASNEFAKNAKTTLTSVSATLPVSRGALALGANQAVFLCEHARSGGGSREIVVTVCGD